MYGQKLILLVSLGRTGLFQNQYADCVFTSIDFKAVGFQKNPIMATSFGPNLPSEAINYHPHRCNCCRHNIHRFEDRNNYHIHRWLVVAVAVHSPQRMAGRDHWTPPVAGAGQSWRRMVGRGRLTLVVVVVVHIRIRCYLLRRTGIPVRRNRPRIPKYHRIEAAAVVAAAAAARIRFPIPNCLPPLVAVVAARIHRRSPGFLVRSSHYRKPKFLAVAVVAVVHIHCCLQRTKGLDQSAAALLLGAGASLSGSRRGPSRRSN
mmetsp:Transcript_18569/g.42909  ORF Transcript_18569/g.42909 Transcript_18569/m.42909 type:complete len:261 (+) Transcript_18569:209-991(+)